MTSPFTQLPPEIVVYIFSHIPDLTDALCLGLTNTLVWACGELHIHALFHTLHAPWAGHSVICLGESAKTLPSGVCSEQQLLGYAAALGEPQFFNIDEASRKGDPRKQKYPPAQTQVSHRYVSRPDSVSADHHHPSRSELDFSSQRITNFVHNILYERSYYHRPARILEKERREFPKRPRISKRVKDAGLVAWTHPSREQKFLQVPPPAHSPNNANNDAPPAGEIGDGAGDSEDRMIMLLRNLTKKLYLRSDTLPVTGDDPFYGFGPALIRRICWTDPTTCSAWYESAVCEGAWAGDQFDVIPVSTSVSDSNPGSSSMGDNSGGGGELSVKELDESGWEDVTGVLKKEMIASWELHLGPDWKNWAW